MGSKATKSNGIKNFDNDYVLQVLPVMADNSAHSN